MKNWLLVRPGDRDHAVYKQPEPQPETLDEIKGRVSDHDEVLEALCKKISSQRFLGPQGGHRIACAVAKAHGFTFRELVSRRRHRGLVRARWHAMWEIKNNTPLSYPEIGRVLGGLDHTTVLHGVRRHQERLDRGEI